eukprot:CAMPEP_0177606888 /NCGR_PEP_ID=MMETSP0419_2-20121207/17569_1 /TAXON_ID=582737 /ORGANISM="Tetraselmis sp., Strain GSL018" /LENGTH=827 /DNA_ID=CAMNT_0019101323 /DNA_START=311 /DNA_END=2796 /DNA_ORIENTATION=-
MESMLMDEPGGRRQKILRGLTTKMKNIVGSSTDKDMEKVIQAVKQKLGHEFEDTLSKEVDEIESQLGSGALDESPKSPPRAPPSKEEVASILSDSLVGAEDLDDAVEKRAKELEAEEKLDPRKRHGYYIVGWVKQPPWPFQKIHDRNGRDTGVVGLCAPFIKYYYNSMWEKALFWRLKARGHVMLGISSYEWFPGNATNPITDRTPQLNPEDKKMYASVDAFAHCFRKPWEHIAPGIPRALISQSDFVNADSSDLQPKGLAKQYTFGHSNLAGVWNDFNRNWTVTVKCVKLAVKNGMNVLLVGKKKDADKNPKRIAEIKPLIDKGSVTITDMLPHRELGDVMEKSRFWFVPNQSDASPRVVAEALCRGTPVIMNRHIAGGWKYINDQTGVFFDGPDDFLPAIERLEKLRAAGKLRPREWFMENYGNHRSSLRLQALLELAVGKDRLEKARALATSGDEACNQPPGAGGGAPVPPDAAEGVGLGRRRAAVCNWYFKVTPRTWKGILPSRGRGERYVQTCRHLTLNHCLGQSLPAVKHALPALPWAVSLHVPSLKFPPLNGTATCSHWDEREGGGARPSSKPVPPCVAPWRSWTKRRLRAVAPSPEEEHPVVELLHCLVLGVHLLPKGDEVRKGVEREDHLPLLDPVLGLEDLLHLVPGVDPWPEEELRQGDAVHGLVLVPHGEHLVDSDPAEILLPEDVEPERAVEAEAPDAVRWHLPRGLLSPLLGLAVGTAGGAAAASSRAASVGFWAASKEESSAAGAAALSVSAEVSLGPSATLADCSSLLAALQILSIRPAFRGPLLLKRRAETEAHRVARTEQSIWLRAAAV